MYSRIDITEKHISDLIGDLRLIEISIDASANTTESKFNILRNKIDAKKSEINAMKSEINAMKSKINAMKSEIWERHAKAK